MDLFTFYIVPVHVNGPSPLIFIHQGYMLHLQVPHQGYMLHLRTTCVAISFFVLCFILIRHLC